MDKIKLIFIFSFISFCSNVQASHLLGGQWSYIFLEQLPNGKVKYAVQLDTYIDCTAQSELPVPESPILYGIYSNNQSEFKQLIEIRTLNLIESNTTLPNFPSDCIINFSICITQAVYRDTIEIPSSNLGYILFYERCCRSSQIISLNGASQTSESFIALIPPTNIHNSTPAPINQSLPLVCIGDTFKINNYAIDPDGDIVIYNWVHPYAGFGDPSNTIPLLPNTLAYAPPLVSYTNGFNFTNPTGINNYHYLNGQNGYMEFTGSTQGSFVIAYEAIEFRNNIEINRNRREFQVAVTQCPQNTIPSISINPKISTINEEEYTCYSIEISDTDSITWEYNGNIFDNLTHSIDTMSYNGNTLSLKICFFPICEDASAENYWGFINVLDKGCIPKSNLGYFSLQVDSNKPNIALFYPEYSCLNDTINVFSNTHTGSWTWQVNNGQLISSLNQNYISILANSIGIINVNLFWHGICNSDTTQAQIEVKIPPQINIIGPINVCEAYTYSYTYSTANTIGNIAWYFNNNYLGSNDSIQLSFNQVGWLIIEVLDENYCPYRDSIYINLYPKANAIPTNTISCYNQTVQILVDPAYTWNLLNQEFLISINPSSWIFQPTSSINYFYTYSDSNGCEWDSSFTITIPYSPIGNQDTIICPNIEFIIENNNPNLINCYFNPTPTNTINCTANYLLREDQMIFIIWEYEGNCKDTVIYNIDVIEVPKPAIELSILDTLCEGLSYKLFNPNSLITDSTIWIYENTTYNNGQFEIILNFDMTHTITQESWKNNCHLDSSINIITPNIFDLLKIEIPNILTPNNDQINDYWESYLPNSLSECTEFEVRNRWGQLIYKSDKINWSPKNISSGVYFLILKIEENLKKSTVTIISE